MDALVKKPVTLSGASLMVGASSSFFACPFPLATTVFAPALFFVASAKTAAGDGRTWL